MLADHQIKDKWLEFKRIKLETEGLSTCAIKLVRWATNDIEQRANLQLRAKQQELEHLQDKLALLIEQIQKIT